MRPEGRALMAPGTLRRALHRTKSKMCARPPGCSPLPSLCGDAVQREYRDSRAIPSPPGTHVRVVIGPQSLLQSLSQTERYLSFRNGVIGMAAARVSEERPGRCWRNSRKRRVLNVTLTHSWMSPARQPNVHAAQQSRLIHTAGSFASFFLTVPVRSPEGVVKTGEVAECGHGGHCDRALHPAQGLEGVDHWGKPPDLHLGVEFLFQTCQSFGVSVTARTSAWNTICWAGVGQTTSLSQRRGAGPQVARPV